MGWEQANPHGSGFQNCGAIAPWPGQDAIVLTGGDTAGLHKSSNRGKTFVNRDASLVGVDSHVACIEPHPTQSGRWFALVGNGTLGSLFESTDNGENWHDASVGQANVFGDGALIGNSGANSLLGNGNGEHPRSVGRLIAVDATNGFIYVGTFSHGVYRGTLGATTGITSWTQIGLVTNFYVRGVLYDAANDVLYASTFSDPGSNFTTAGGHVYRCLTPRSGGTFTSLSGSPWCASAMLLIGDVLYTVAHPITANLTSKGLWSLPSAHNAAAGTAWTKIAALPTASTERWMSLDGYKAGATTTLWCGSASDGAHSLCKLVNPGTGWVATIYPTSTATTINDMGGPNTPADPWWMYTARAGMMLGRATFVASTIRINPANTQEIYVFGRSGIWRTQDGGAHWYPVVKGIGATVCLTVITDGRTVTSGSPSALLGAAPKPRSGRNRAAELAFLDSEISPGKFPSARIYNSIPWNGPANEESQLLAAGKTMCMTFSPGAYSYAQVAQGAADAAIDATGDALVAAGAKNILCGFEHEPEKHAAANGTAAEYKAAFQRFSTRIKARGATNKIVCILEGFTYNTTSPHYPPSQYDPGDGYRDYMGADAYNWFGRDGTWKTFAQVFAAFQTWMSANRPGIGLVIGEVATDVDPNNSTRKAQWITGMLATLKTSAWSSIIAVYYFNSQDQNTNNDPPPAPYQWYFDADLYQPSQVPGQIAAMKTIATDPFFTSTPTIQNSDNVYVGLGDWSILASADNLATVSNPAPPSGSFAYSTCIDESTNPTTLITAASPRSDQTGYTSKIYRNPNVLGGGAWVDTGFSVANHIIVALTVIYLAGQRIYLAGDDSGVLWRKAGDAGTWTQVPLANMSPSGGINFSGSDTHPFARNINRAAVYLYDRSTGVWRSTDGGLHWVRIWNHPSGNSSDQSGWVAVDPQSAHVVYVSDIGSVYKITNADTCAQDAATVVTLAAAIGAKGPMAVDPVNLKIGVCDITATPRFWESPISPLNWVDKSDQLYQNAVSAPQWLSYDKSGLPIVALSGNGVIRLVQAAGIPPVATISTPTPNQVFAVGTTSVTLSGTVTDDASGSTASYSLDGGAPVTLPLSAGAYSRAVVVAPGAHTIVVTAVDAGGLTDTDTVAFTVTADVTSPTLAVTTPAGDGTVSNATATQTVAGTASDDVALASLKVNGTAVLVSAGSFSTSIPLVVGSNTITVVATDTSGNTRTVTRTITRSSGSANTPPTVAISTPTDNQVFPAGTTSVTFSGTCTDDASGVVGSWTVDGGGARSIAIVANAFSVVSPAIGPGSHTFIITVTDAGGLTSTDTVIFTVSATSDVTRPVLSVTTPAANGTVSNGVTAQTVAGTASDDVALASVKVNGTVVPVTGGTGGGTTVDKSGVIGATTAPAFRINGVRTHVGQAAEGLLVNMRMVTSIFDDMNAGTYAKWRYPGGGTYSPARQTNEFVAQLAAYQAAGVDAVTISLMGALADPTATTQPWPWDACAFNTDGTIPTTGSRVGFWTRLDQALAALDAQGMIAIVQLLYAGGINRLANATAVNTAADAWVDWILAKGYRNVIFSIGNEVDNSHYTFSVDTDSGHGGADTGRIGLLDRIRARLVAGGWAVPLVGLSYGSNAASAYPSNAVLPHADWVGFSNNSNTAANITSRLTAIRAFANYIAVPKPILVVEDSSFELYGSAGQDRYDTAVSHQCSTGLYIQGSAGAFTGGDYQTGFQSVPTPWGLLSGNGGLSGVANTTKKLWTDWATGATGGGPGGGGGGFSTSVPLVVGSNTITVIATDTSGNTQTVTRTITRAAADVPPSFGGVPTINGQVIGGNTVTVTDAPFTGTPTPVLTRKWLLDGVDTGQTGTSFAIPATTDDGKILTVTNHIASTAGTADATSLPSAAITTPADPPPVWSVEPSVTGTAQSGDTVTGHNGTLSPGSVTAQKWQSSPSGLAGSQVDIGGATATTLLLPADDSLAGGYVRYVPHGVNGATSVDEPSAWFGPIAQAPIVSVAPSCTRIPVVGVALVTLSLDDGDWDSVPAAVLTHQLRSSIDDGQTWQNVPGVGSSFVVTPTLYGAIFDLVVTADNGIDPPVTATSQPTAVIADPGGGGGGFDVVVVSQDVSEITLRVSQRGL